MQFMTTSDSILFGSEGATGKLGLRKGPVML